MRESGIRGLFSYGYPAGTGANTLARTQQMDIADLQRVMQQYFGGKQRNADGMLSLGAAIRSMNFTNNPTTGAEADWKAARELGLVLTMHASARGSGRRARTSAGFWGPMSCSSTAAATPTTSARSSPSTVSASRWRPTATCARRTTCRR